MVELKKENISEIVNLIKQGKIVALPTDTIYGFSCLATSNKAVKKLCELKRCADDKLFILLVSKNYDLNNLAVLNEQTKKFISKNTPNPVTMILQKNKNLKLAKNFYSPTIAVRVPDNEFLQQILEHVGFMISTSCNVHGQANLTNFKDIKNTFSSLDAIVECNNVNYNSSSTIVDLTTLDHKILRQGNYVVK